MRKKGAALRAAQDDDTMLRPSSGQAFLPGVGLTPHTASPPAPLTASGASRGRGKPPPPPALPDFAPVPRRYRHDGWTPERQKAFIEALADTGCVQRAANMVNMAQQNCYALRRAPGAEAFRQAWDAALDFGLKRLKDIAFERAIEGQLVPVFVAGKLMGFRRKRNDALLMFCLRHYGQDGQGKRTTINYFSSRASAGAVAGAGASPPPPAGAAPPPPSAVPQAPPSDARLSPGQAALLAPEQARGGIAEASTTTVRTVISGGRGDGAAQGDEAADVLNGFQGVALDAEAEAAIAAALEACAARAREADAAYDQGGEAAVDAAEDDPGQSYFPVRELGDPYRGELLPPVQIEDFVPFVPEEAPWAMTGAEKPAQLVEFEEEMARRRRAKEG